MNELIGSVVIVNDRDVCLDCLVEICGVKNGLMPLFRIMDNEQRDAIIQNCTSLKGEELDELISPSLLCQHKLCRSLILARLREGCQDDYLECAGCDALVCKFCFDYKDGCLDEAILNARKTDATAAATVSTLTTSDLSSSTFQVGYENNANNNITFSLANLTASGLSADVTVSTLSGAQAALTQIDTALDTLANARATIGRTQNQFGFATANLASTMENLSAAESVIRDADMAFETVAFTKNQILLQAGTSMLAQANQAPQSVLSLLG